MNDKQYANVYYADTGTAVGIHASAFLLALIRKETAVPLPVLGQRFHLMELTDPTCRGNEVWHLRYSGHECEEVIDYANTGNVLVVLPNIQDVERRGQ